MKENYVHGFTISWRMPCLELSLYYTISNSFLHWGNLSLHLWENCNNLLLLQHLILWKNKIYVKVCWKYHSLNLAFITTESHWLHISLSITEFIGESMQEVTFFAMHLLSSWSFWGRCSYIIFSKIFVNVFPLHVQKRFKRFENWYLLIFCIFIFN